MKALKRIKEIEKYEATGQWPIEHKDGQFLLKAFQVMREIAFEYGEEYLGNKKELDKEFELSMTQRIDQ